VLGRSTHKSSLSLEHRVASLSTVATHGQPNISSSPRAEYAQASLREVLKTMNARLVSDAETTLPLLGKTFDASEIAANPAFAALIQSSIQKIASSL
jgi:hypothetical protein